MIRRPYACLRRPCPSRVKWQTSVRRAKCSVSRRWFRDDDLTASYTCIISQLHEAGQMRYLYIWNRLWKKHFLRLQDSLRNKITRRDKTAREISAFPSSSRLGAWRTNEISFSSDTFETLTTNYSFICLSVYLRLFTISLLTFLVSFFVSSIY